VREEVGSLQGSVPLPDLPDVRRAQSRGLEPLSRRQPAARAVFGTAARLYRNRFRRIALCAIAVFATTTWLDAVIEVLIDQHRLAGSGWDAVLETAASILATLGFVAYAGILDRVLEDQFADRPTRPLRAMLRSLPIFRLILADLVLTLSATLGFVLLILPGVVVFTLFCLVGPVIASEDRGVFSALRRSAQLVRHRFWLVLALVTVPVLLEEEVVHVVDYRTFDHPLLAAFFIVGFLGAAVASLVGVVEVVIANELARLHPRTDVGADTVSQQ
jgi:hypothetical protein